MSCLEFAASRAQARLDHIPRPTGSPGAHNAREKRQYALITMPFAAFSLAKPLPGPRVYRITAGGAGQFEGKDRRMNWLGDTIGQGPATAVTWIVAVLVILVLFLHALRMVRAMLPGTYVRGGKSKHRLAVVDAAPVDAKRRLILVRRDGVEHLLLIGGAGDVVVEPAIGHGPAAMPRPAQGPGRTAGPARQPAPPAQPRQPARAEQEMDRERAASIAAAVAAAPAVAAMATHREEPREEAAPPLPPDHGVEHAPAPEPVPEAPPPPPTGEPVPPAARTSETPVAEPAPASIDMPAYEEPAPAPPVGTHQPTWQLTQAAPPAPAPSPVPEPEPAAAAGQDEDDDVLTSDLMRELQETLAPVREPQPAQAPEPAPAPQAETPEPQPQAEKRELSLEEEMSLLLQDLTRDSKG
ncbi:hypothetical protein CSC94_13055 [Zhengella mangrovi]|uniref:Flagellar biosynthesis protein FliO n=2 Tax=Zhengella mangrovi TaxID=1982044 RepID=A0A2G1QN17_9HYPH|nr:hypothetical protein CSC94_13055 [Zhengella mangrovi]